METDPSFQLVDILPDAAYDVVAIAARIDLRKTQKEENTMQKKLSTFEKVFREEGRAEGLAEGTENTIRNFIERKRNRHVSDEQIHEELLLDFGLSAIQARKFMEPGLAKA